MHELSDIYTEIGKRLKVSVILFNYKTKLIAFSTNPV